MKELEQCCKSTKDQIDVLLSRLDSRLNDAPLETERMMDEAADCIRELQAELERERIRLAACGVVAMADTPDSAAKARQMHPDYYSASCGDVERRVDECISLRQKCADLQAELDKIKGSEVVGYMNEHGEVYENTGSIPLIRRPE